MSISKLDADTMDSELDRLEGEGGAIINDDEKTDGQVIDEAVTAAEDPDSEAAKLAEEIRLHEEALEKLEPLADPKTWTIGKPPENGGKIKETYEMYTQDAMGFMERNRFFALVGKTMAKSIKETGGSVGGMDDVFGNSGGSINDRVGKLRSRDFQDASSFFQLAFELINYSPDFLLECYCLWLAIPRDDRKWAKAVMDQPWDPENDQWGLKEEDGVEMVERFIDQNYEDIRRFFTESLPKLSLRVSKQEKSRMASKSELSK